MLYSNQLFICKFNNLIIKLQNNKISLKYPQNRHHHKDGSPCDFFLFVVQIRNPNNCEKIINCSLFYENPSSIC